MRSAGGPSKGGLIGERTGGDAGLTFPDQPRLDLDQLLAELIDRAHDVMVTQGRLRGLLAAEQLIVADLGVARRPPPHRRGGPAS